MFEWGKDLGYRDFTPELGVVLGLYYIKGFIHREGGNYEVTWNATNKCFVVTKIVEWKTGSRCEATPIMFGDFELLQNGSPEAIFDIFEARVRNAMMTLQQSAYVKSVKRKNKT
jgi:hypothetical protein